jgi:hypothetical protein
MTGRMTKGERDDLVRLVKQREKVAKSAAEQRSAMMLADFEREIAATHTFDKRRWRPDSRPPKRPTRRS